MSDDVKKAAIRALAVFDWLADNQPDCFGWEPPFPSTTPTIKIEADALRAALSMTLTPYARLNQERDEV